ncbi:translation initiation factor IF-2-like [Parus major]|uniref:translation initiation factor IF-2-like n=1 Tax=Parus major TaxID=9157 RepID=UPI00077122CB|nr:translation initiation factor IF-2-like [Parus major]
MTPAPLTLPGSPGRRGRGVHLAAALRHGAPLPASLPPRPPRPTCGGSKTTATPSARGEGREVLTLGRCRRAGFAGGGWERARGGAEPGGGSPALPPRAARAAPRRAGGGGGAGRGEGWSAAGVGQRCRPGSAPAWRLARRDRRLLRPVPGWFLWLRSARRAAGALPPEGKGPAKRAAASFCRLDPRRQRRRSPPSPTRAAPACPASGTGLGQYAREMEERKRSLERRQLTWNRNRHSQVALSKDPKMLSETCVLVLGERCCSRAY